MTNAKVLNAPEINLIKCLTNRLPWNIAKSILSSLGFTLAHGKEKTLVKVLSDFEEIKNKKPQGFAKILKEINEILFTQFLYGDKCIYSISISGSDMDALKNSIKKDWAANHSLTNVHDIILTDAKVKAKSKNKLDLFYYSADKNQAIVLFSTIREQIIKENIAPSSVPGYSNYDEIIAKTKIKKQCFDSCLLDFNKNVINIMIDISGDASPAESLFPKSVVLRKLSEYAGYDFSYNEKDFFPVIEPICDQNKPPYNQIVYKVFDISFHTNEGTSHKERKSDASKDLRNDIFNKAGIKAVGKIGIYRVGIRVERTNAALQLYDNLELVIPGTLRRFLSGSKITPVNNGGKTSPVTYAIIRNCITRDDFETLTKLIIA